MKNIFITKAIDDICVLVNGQATRLYSNMGILLNQIMGVNLPLINGRLICGGKTGPTSFIHSQFRVVTVALY